MVHLLLVVLCAADESTDAVVARASAVLGEAHALRQARYQARMGQLTSPLDQPSETLRGAGPYPGRGGLQAPGRGYAGRDAGREAGSNAGRELRVAGRESRAADREARGEGREPRVAGRSGRGRGPVGVSGRGRRLQSGASGSGDSDDEESAAASGSGRRSQPGEQLVRNSCIKGKLYELYA